MTRPIRLFALVLVVAAAFGAGAWVHAQTVQPAAPTIISGNDIGFRVDEPATRARGRVTGNWVIRVNGQWVEPSYSGGLKQLAAN
jgi:hypothetical protein